MVFLAERGYRRIAHDRRGRGRSGQLWNGNDMDTCADDLAALFDALNLKDAMMVGHSTGGGEVARYIGRHGSARVSKAVLVGAVPPIMLKTAANPGGLPMEVFDGIRAAVRADRSQFFKDLTTPFYGANRPGNKVSQGMRDTFWMIGMQGSLKAEGPRKMSEEVVLEDPGPPHPNDQLRLRSTPRVPSPLSRRFLRHRRLLVQV